MRMKKRPITLIEIFVALGLMAILCATLFNYFKQSTVYSRELEYAKHHVFARSHVQQRLLQIFSNIADDGEFYTSDHRTNPLRFVFDNGVDPERQFCRSINAEIYLDRLNQTLHLLTWPLLQEKSRAKDLRNEILLKRVDSLSYDFFKTNSFETQEEQSRKMIEKKSSWSQQEGGLPSFFVIRLEQITNDDERQPYSFAFYLNREISGVSYPASGDQ